MKFLNAIKAFFTFKGEEKEIEVPSAQVSKRGRFYTLLKIRIG